MPVHTHADIIRLNLNSVMWGFYNAWAHTGFVCGMPWILHGLCTMPYPKQHYKLVLLLICHLKNKVYSDPKTQVTQNESVLVFSYSSTHLVKCMKDYIRAQILAVMSRVLSKVPHQKDTEFVIKLIQPNLQKL